MLKQNDERRYYLAVSVASYIIEDNGHTKVEAMNEFNITRGVFDRLFDFLKTHNLNLYLKAKNQLALNTCPRAANVARYLLNGHTKLEASEHFHESLDTIDECLQTINSLNEHLYNRIEAQLETLSNSSVCEPK